MTEMQRSSSGSSPRRRIPEYASRRFDPILPEPPADGWLCEDAAPEVLHKIRQRRTLLAAWHRSGLQELGAWLDELPGERLPVGRARLRPRDVPDALEAFCAAAKTPPGPPREVLARDILALAALVSAIAERAELELRLETLDHDGCSLFHVDRVDIRLLCTYRGPGTELVPPAEAATAVRRQRDYAGPLLRLPRFCAGLAKGAGATATPLVHRSPRISGSGLQRLLVCLTAAS